jgi:hypothetical protein
MAKYGDERIQQIIAMTEERGDFGPLEDGYQYYWSKHGALSAWELRVLADELDRRNTLWDADVQKTLAATPDDPAEVFDEGA